MSVQVVRDGVDEYECSASPSSKTTAAVEMTGVTAEMDEAAQSAPQIKRCIILASMGYLCYSIATSVVSPYYGIVLSERHFRPSTIGLLTTFIPVFNIILLPLMTYGADRFRCTRGMMTVVSLATPIGIVVFLVSTQTSYIVVGFLLCVTFQLPMSTFIDRHTLYIFPTEVRTESWSYARAYASLGWGIGNFLVTALVTLTGTWLIVIAQYCVFQVGLLYYLYTTHVEEAATHIPVAVSELVHVFVANPRIAAFLMANCFIGYCLSVVNNFLFIFLNSIHAPTILLGLTILVNILIEIPLFQASDYLFSKLKCRHMMAIALASGFMRFFCFCMLTNPWYVLLIEPLHGLTFAFAWLPAIKVISTSFPPKLANSATGALSIAQCGIGPIISNLLSGVLYERYGARVMFAVNGCILTFGFVMFQVLDVLLEKSGHELKADESMQSVDTIVIESET